MTQLNFRLSFDALIKVGEKIQFAAAQRRRRSQRKGHKLPLIELRLSTLYTTKNDFQRLGARGAEERRDFYLHANLRQIDFHGELLPGIDVWIMRFFESSFQLVKLIGGKSCAITTMLLFGPIRILQIKANQLKKIPRLSVNFELDLDDIAILAQKFKY